MSKTLLARLSLCLLLLLLGPQLLRSQAHPGEKAQEEIRTFLSGFITAFDNLDWEAFRHAFADDATVFYPRGVANRANGRIEFEEQFKQVFEQIRAGRSKGPYMDLQPGELRIQMLGDVAIVTFHLDDRSGFVNRRTLVLIENCGGLEDSASSRFGGGKRPNRGQALNFRLLGEKMRASRSWPGLSL